MHARKWLSNSIEVLKTILEADHAENKDSGELPSMKTLGIIWNAKDDVFTYKSISEEVGTGYTKCLLLKKMVILFDPLGFLSTYIICIKIILQELHISGLDWDDDLPGEHPVKVETCFDELKELSSIQLSRCWKKNAQEKEKSIHTFSDASSEAYGAVAYQQCLYKSEEVTSCLVMSKARVVPLKSISISQLELLGVILG